MKSTKETFFAARRAASQADRDRKHQEREDRASAAVQHIETAEAIRELFGKFTHEVFEAKGRPILPVMILPKLSQRIGADRLPLQHPKHVPRALIQRWGIGWGGYVTIRAAGVYVGDQMPALELFVYDNLSSTEASRSRRYLTRSGHVGRRLHDNDNSNGVDSAHPITANWLMDLQLDEEHNRIPAVQFEPGGYIGPGMYGIDRLEPQQLRRELQDTARYLGLVGLAEPQDAPLTQPQDAR